MGLVPTNVIPLLKEHIRRPITGHILCLGVAKTHFTRAHFLQMANQIGADLAGALTEFPDGDTDAVRNEAISASEFFVALGAGSVSSLDFSDYEGADILFDLNSDRIPQELVGQFDLIVDHGTIEHVFHVPNVMRNIHSLLIDEGRVFHSSPGSNFFDHGFYSFSPTFFNDYYSSNRWQIDMLDVYQMDRDLHFPPFYARYAPDWFAGHSYGGMNNKMYGTICVATKTPDCTADIAPQQTRYRQALGWLDGTACMGQI